MAIVFEFSESISLVSDQIDIFDFIINLVTVLDERSEVGVTLRAQVVYYGNDIVTMASVSQFGIGRGVITNLLNFRETPTQSGDASGLPDALDSVRTDFRSTILNDPTIAHAVIVLKHSLAGTGPLRQALNILYWFMDQAVPVIIVG